jgi:hypothetical protein
VNREAELDRPSRVACSDLLGIISRTPFQPTSLRSSTDGSTDETNERQNAEEHERDGPQIEPVTTLEHVDEHPNRVKQHRGWSNNPYRASSKHAEQETDYKWVNE